MNDECDKCGYHTLECFCEGWDTRNNNGWISVDKELPPRDGLYEVSNSVKSISAQGCLFYDGIGFIYDRIYRPVEFWRYHIVEMKKRYGKV